jgi:hypothetical protein
VSQEDSLKLAAEIVDKFSGPLREMTKSVHAFQDILKHGQAEGAKGAHEFYKKQTELNDTFEKTARNVTGFLSPSMVALGLSVGGAGEAVKTLIDKLRESGDSFFKIQDAMARTGQTAPQLDALVQTMGRFGISADAAREHASKLGDIAAQLRRQWSPTVAALESTFTDLHPLWDKIAKQSAEEGNKTFWQYYWSAPVQAAPPDKRRRFLEAAGQDPAIASITREQFMKAQAEETARVAANPDLTLKQLEALNQAFGHLKGSVDNFWRAMERAFGDSAIKMIEYFGRKMEERAKEIVALKQAWDAMFGKAVPGSPFQPLPKWPEVGTAEHPFPEPPADKFSSASRFMGGYQPMSFTTGGGGDESASSRIIERGTYDALVAWYASLQAGGGGGAGIVKASLGGSGGGGGRGWGGGGYRQLDEGDTGEAGAAGKPVPGGGPHPAPGGVGNAAGGGGDGGPTGLSGSAYLQAERARYGKELGANSALKKRLAAIVDLENPKAGTAVTESLMNRMNLVHGSLEHGIAGGPHSFYGPARHPGMVEARMRELERDPKRMAARMAQIDQALAGSNQTKGYTDQGSRGDPNYERGGIGVNINRERFNDWGVPGSRAYRERQQAMVRSGGQRDLLSNGASAGFGGNAHKIEGGASLDVNFRNAPEGTRAYLRSHGIFADGTKVDWGVAMPHSNSGGS